MLKELLFAAVLAFFVWMMYLPKGGGKSADQEWYDDMEKHKRGED